MKRALIRVTTNYINLKGTKPLPRDRVSVPAKLKALTPGYYWVQVVKRGGVPITILPTPTLYYHPAQYVEGAAICRTLLDALGIPIPVERITYRVKFTRRRK